MKRQRTTQKSSDYLFWILTILVVSILSTPCTLFSATEEQKPVKIIREKPQYDSSATLISRSETLKAGWSEYNPKKLFTGQSTDILDGKLHANTLTNTLYKNQQQRDAKHIENLRKNIQKNKPLFTKYKKINSALYTNEARASKKIAVANRSKSQVNHSKEGKTYIKKQAMGKLKEQNAIINALPTAIKNQAKNKARLGTYNKTQKIGGIIGPILSIWGASQNSYDYDDDTKVTSFNTGAFLGNTAMNLSGIAGFISAYKEGQQKGILVGIYHGAKCIPLAGDAINVFEVAESSIGLVHDTIQSNKIIADNEKELERQGKAAVSKLKSLFAQIKAKEKEFKKVLQKSNDTIKNFNTLNRQYINIFNRSVEQETNLGSADSLLLAVDNAKPFMDATQIERLMADSEQMMSATATTVKLANSTFDNYQTNGGSPDQLTNTIKELERMVSVLSANRDECTGIENAISPLLGRGQILDTAKETNEQLTTNATLFNDIYIQGRNTLKENSLLVRKAVKLKAEQDTILGESKRSLSYFYRHGTPQTTSDLEIAFRQTLQYKIDDYDLKKLNSGHKTISIKFQDWRQIATVQKDYPPETINTIYNAETILPAITKLKEVLTEKIKIAKETIEKFNAPVKPDSIASTVRNDSSQTSTIQDKEFLTSTLKDIIKKITPSTRQDSQSPQSMHGYSICGFTFFKNNIEQARAIGNNPDSKPIPLFYDGYRKLLEKGTINIWYDNNGNNIRDIGEEKQEPYWIWYHSKFYITGSWFLWGDEEQTNSRFKDYAKSMSEQSQFSNKNIAMGVTGLSTRRDKTIVGNVYTTPFNLNARISVRAQVGKNTYFESAADNSSEYYEKYRSNVLEKISFWETGRKEQLRNTMTCLMELPKEYVTLTEKYFYKNIQELSPEIQLGGFEIVRQKESERTFSKEFRRKTPLENSNTKKNIVYSIHMKILKADLNDAWNTVLKDGDKRILANGSSSDHPWAMQVTGADITNATRVAKKTKHTKRITTKKRISVPDFYVKERIFIRKANVFVRVLGSGSHMESPELETKQIAESILAKFFKENL